MVEINDHPIIPLEPITDEIISTSQEIDEIEEQDIVAHTQEESFIETTEELTVAEEQVPQEIILPENIIEEDTTEELETVEDSSQDYSEDIYDEDYIDPSADFITSEPSLQLNEEFVEEDNISIDEEINDFDNEVSEVILPDPTIDERIEEDLPEVEALFEELPEDVEITPYENTLVQEPAQLMPDDEELVRQVAKEIDETFIYKKIEEDNLFDEDALTEDDLNYIDDINLNEDENIEQVEEFEQIQANRTQSQQENLPIYPAKTPTTQKVFEAGDHVAHPKYGEGIVEKMISAGDKTLCSINFANFGRRLLDPAISEITIL